MFCLTVAFPIMWKYWAENFRAQQSAVWGSSGSVECPHAQEKHPLISGQPCSYFEDHPPFRQNAGTKHKEKSNDCQAFCSSQLLGRRLLDYYFYTINYLSAWTSGNQVISACQTVEIAGDQTSLSKSLLSHILTF